jgi:hypothetical protein
VAGSRHVPYSVHQRFAASDIIGLEVFSASTESFIFHPGPILSNIILVDELNRASPRFKPITWFAVSSVRETFISTGLSSSPYFLP